MRWDKCPRADSRRAFYSIDIRACGSTSNLYQSSGHGAAAWPWSKVDGEKFYVVRGDQLMERDQVIVEWIHLIRPDLVETESSAWRDMM